MIVKIGFTKASGAGNDFIVLDNMDGALAADPSVLAPVLCDRHFGIGADGVLVLAKSNRADFLMQYYNADGSYGGMCGNGGRCAARIAFLKGIAPHAHRFEALGHIYDAWVGDSTVRLRMKDPSDVRTRIHLEIPEGTFSGTFVNTGAPHFVAFVHDVDGQNVMSAGPILRQHPTFGADGTNVDFVAVRGEHLVSLRTYERGVEAETLACGTGSIAAAVASCLDGQTHSPVRVSARSGEELLVTMTVQGAGISDVFLEGSAHILFEGRCLVNLAHNTLEDLYTEEKGSSRT